MKPNEARLALPGLSTMYPVIWIGEANRKKGTQKHFLFSFSFFLLRKGHNQIGVRCKS